jgi:peroxiredoxin
LLSLSELRGRRVVLAFYPADWSPVCGEQMTLYNQVLPEFRNRGAELVGISVDGAWCHQAYARYNNLHFPLLADFEPKGEVARLRRCLPPAELGPDLPAWPCGAAAGIRCGLRPPGRRAYGALGS